MKSVKKASNLFLVFATLCAVVFGLQLFNPGVALAYRRVCDGFSCWTVICDKHSDCGTNGYTGGQYCQGNEIFQNYTTYTCNSPGGAYSSCTSATVSQKQQTCSYNQPYCVNGKCSNQQSSYCTSNYSKKCVGNSVYWFDSCGKQGGIVQSCSGYQTCLNGLCNDTNQAAQQSYNPHALKGCVYNSVYWYDSYGTENDLYQNCNSTSATCSNGQCIGGKAATYTPPPPPPKGFTPPPYQQPSQPNPYQYKTTFIPHYKTDCFQNNIFWYDSAGGVQDVYKNCVDSDPCTLDTCEKGQCKNEIKCGGSTCDVDTVEFAKSCPEQARTLAATKPKNQENTPTSQDAAKTDPFKNKVAIIIFGLIVLGILFVVIFRNVSKKV